MKYERLKKGLVTLAMVGAVVLSSGVASESMVMAQGRDRWEHRDRHDRDSERREMERVRRLDRQRQLRYQYRGGNRIVGYHDRFGRFHAYGYYDRFGGFHRY
ncbi:MAG TPA: hypothetical protein VJ302_23055 [Blastocatellia bacterium]|nr:hypothetical protein [Blastocatellia bacterium]